MPFCPFPSQYSLGGKIDILPRTFCKLFSPAQNLPNTPWATKSILYEKFFVNSSWMKASMLSAPLSPNTHWEAKTDLGQIFWNNPLTTPWAKNPEIGENFLIIFGTRIRIRSDGDESFYIPSVIPGDAPAPTSEQPILLMANSSGLQTRRFAKPAALRSSRSACFTREQPLWAARGSRKV